MKWKDHTGQCCFSLTENETRAHLRGSLTAKSPKSPTWLFTSPGLATWEPGTAWRTASGLPPCTRHPAYISSGFFSLAKETPEKASLGEAKKQPTDLREALTPWALKHKHPVQLQLHHSLPQCPETSHRSPTCLYLLLCKMGPIAPTSQ